MLPTLTCLLLFSMKQSCHPSQGARQDSPKESPPLGIRVAGNWGPTKSGMATLRHSSVSFVLSFWCRWSTITKLPARDLYHLQSFCFFFSRGGHSPEPHILLFRRPLGTDPQSGRVDPDLERKARDEYRAQYGNRK